MTADLERVVTVLTEKARRLPRDGYTDDEWLAVIVGTVVADTAMIVEGTVPIERWEAT